MTDTAEHATPANHLANETSPYLLQHVHNPVDWYPWGDEALARARSEDKPIFLSIGYAACHWCHVMERESFENSAVADLLNAHFISIKVDREERPDLDDIYMIAVQMMTGSGGWPMSVFLTPDLKPFYGGTYFPPDDRYGRPGFISVLGALAQAWDTRRNDVVESGDELAQLIEKHGTGVGKTRCPLPEGLLEGAVRQLATAYDPTDGGFGTAPKFPSAPSIALLLRHALKQHDAVARDMAVTTLTKMAHGGLYDHLGGGFHRYSVDAQWLVPHFEKMLYDNAQLADVYLEAYQFTGLPLFRRVVVETLDYLLRDMQGPEGAFYSSEDADSEGEEGKFYLWTQAEIEEALDKETARVVCGYYAVRRDGNFPSPEPYHANQNILHITADLESVATQLALTTEEVRERLAYGKQVLLDRRSKRIRPGLDDKILAGWNGLAIGAFARAATVLDESRYREAAERAAGFVSTALMQHGKLLHTHRNGISRIPAFQDDYAFLAQAMLNLYEATFEVTWLERADEFTRTMIDQFWDETNGGFFTTSTAHDNLLVRTKTTYDGAVPSGDSVAALALLQLAKLLDKPDYFEMAQTILELNAQGMQELPHAHLKMLCAADFFDTPPAEIAIAGPRGDERVTAFFETLHHHFIPNKIVAYVDPSTDSVDDLAKRVPLLMSKALVNGAPAAYVCHDFTCDAPVTTPDALTRSLGIAPAKE